MTIKEKFKKINPHFLGLILFLLFLFLPLLTYKYSSMNGDMAEYLNNPLRVINGQMPYRDFWLLMSPGEVFLPALIYKIFGLNINSLLVFSLLISALVGLMSFILGRLIFKDNFFATIAALLLFFSGIPAYVGYTYINAYFLLLLVASFYFVKYWQKKVTHYLFLAGLFIGLAFLFRIYEVGAALLALLLLILIQGKFKKQAVRTTIKSVVIFVSGIMLVIAFTSLLLIRIWLPMVRQIVFESLSHGTSMNLPFFYDAVPASVPAMNDLKMVMAGNFLSLINFFYHLLNFMNITLYYLLPFLLVGISVWFLFSRRFNHNDKIVVLLFLSWGIFTLPKALGRADIAHVSVAVSPLLFLLIFILMRVKGKFKENKSCFIKATKYGLVVITIILLTPVLNFIIQTRSVLATPYVQITTKHGELFIRDRAKAKDINDVIDYISQNTQEGDYIFVTPWFSPPLYALTNRKNPTYYDSLIDLIALPSKEKQERVCQALLSKKTKVIIHNPDWGFDNKKELQFLTTCPIIQQCIDDNFKLVKKDGYYWIYIPKK